MFNLEIKSKITQRVHSITKEEKWFVEPFVNLDGLEDCVGLFGPFDTVEIAKAESQVMANKILKTIQVALDISDDEKVLNNHTGKFETLKESLGGLNKGE